MTPPAIDDARADDEPLPKIRTLLKSLETADGPSVTDLSPEAARDLVAGMFGRGSDIPIASVEDRRIDGPGGKIPIRIYDSDPGAVESRPTLCYFHGGGWVFGSLDSADGTCRTLATETGFPVVSVDYRLAPEHPFPAGLEDCYAALEWAAANVDELGGDPDRLVLAGDSAGGNLATTTCMVTAYRDGPPVAYQVLVYPVTGDPSGTDAYEENAEGYLLTADQDEWFRNHYFEHDVHAANVFASPRLASDRLLGDLPPATVVTAGFDLLRDDGAAYADRLEAAGVPVTYRNYPGAIHSFFGMLESPVSLEVAHEAHAAVAADLRDALE